MPEIIQGSVIAEQCRAETAEKVKKLFEKTGKKPSLHVIIVGENPASVVYVRNKEKAAVEAGFISVVHRLPDTTTQTELSDLISALNTNDDVDGILVQLPLPKHIDEKIILDEISPEKDVDGFHPVNMGALTCGTPSLVPCTPKGCMVLLHTVLNDLTGLNAVVVGRSNIVGKPAALLLLAENCTVTIAHSKTKNLPDLCRTADILIAAVGKPRFIQADWIKENAVVIDVGINRLENGKLCGDVDFDNALPHCKAITPVPKGVGPMTIAMLLDNTLTAFCKRRGQTV